MQQILLSLISIFDEKCLLRSVKETRTGKSGELISLCEIFQYFIHPRERKFIRNDI